MLQCGVEIPALTGVLTENQDRCALIMRYIATPPLIRQRMYAGTQVKRVTGVVTIGQANGITIRVNRLKWF